ncbi:MAG TPA: DUF2059 domain-containing protein [Pseudolabrys sp.]|jgi:hypothetical protein
MKHVMRAINRTLSASAVAVALMVASPAAFAQGPQPSAAALATAKELVGITGATALFSPLVAGVVEQSKLLFLQQNPMLQKDLNEIAAQMRTELQPRFVEITNEVAHEYASHFTEQELKDILAFYQSPAGKKMLLEQPKVVNNSMQFAQDWANKLSTEVTAKMRDELKKRGHPM